MIKILGLGLKKEIDLPHGSSISKILEYLDIDLSERYVVFSDEKEIESSDFDKEFTHNGVIVISYGTGASGSAPTPKIKNVIKFLKKNNYEKIKGGKGDHMKFKNNVNNTIVILNPDNNDSKHLDLGSAKSLAEKLNMNLVELYREI